MLATWVSWAVSGLTTLVCLCGVTSVLLKKVRYAKAAADPPIANLAPTHPVLTGYDEQHLITYLRLLDADSERADCKSSRVLF